MSTIAKTIRGINVKIGSDTSGLGKALKDVNKKSRDIRSELRKVERLLKFNPGDTELLAQKQQLLNDRVANTSEKLRRLKSVQEQVNQQFEAGEIGAQQYRDFQRELIKTNSKLKTFKRQLEDSSSSGIELGKNLDKLEKKLNGIGNSLSTKITAPVLGAFTALTEGTRDFRKELSILENNTASAGANIDNMSKAMEQMQGVTGELDSNIEGLSNLLASGFKGGKFQQVLDELSGAAIKFKDTLKFESIADGLQETLATGNAVGQFGELLERSGIQLDVFNAGLQEAITNGTEQNYILQALADTGLSQVYKQYRKNNEELVEAAEANYRVKQSFAEIGQELEPIMTNIKEVVAETVGEFNELDESTKELIIKGAGVSAALGPVAIVLGEITTAASILIPVIAGLSGAFAPLAVGGAALAGFIALCDWLKITEEETQKALKKTKDLVGEYEDLTEKEKLNREEKERLSVITERLAMKYPEFIEGIDSETGALKVNVKELAKKVNLEWMLAKVKKKQNELKEKEQRLERNAPAFERNAKELERAIDSQIKYVREQFSLASEMIGEEFDKNISFDEILEKVNSKDFQDKLKLKLADRGQAESFSVFMESIQEVIKMKDQLNEEKMFENKTIKSIDETKDKLSELDKLMNSMQNGLISPSEAVNKMNEIMKKSKNVEEGTSDRSSNDKKVKNQKETQKKLLALEKEYQDKILLEKKEGQTKELEQIKQSREKAIQDAKDQAKEEKATEEELNRTLLAINELYDLKEKEVKEKYLKEEFKTRVEHDNKLRKQREKKNSERIKAESEAYQAEIEVGQKAAEKKKKLLDNRMKYDYKQNKISAEDYKKYLQSRLSEYKEYSDEWISTREKITEIEKGEIEQQQSAWDGFLDRLEEGNLSKADLIQSTWKMAIDSINESLSTTNEELDKLANADISNLVDNFQKFGKSTEGTWKAIGSAVGTIVGSPELGEFAAETNLKVWDEISRLGDRIFGGETSAANWNKQVGLLKEEYQDLAGDLVGDFDLNLPSLADLVDDDIETVTKKIKDGGWFHSDDWAEVLNFPEFKEAFDEQIKKIEEEIVPKLQDIFSNVSNGLNSAFSADSYTSFLSSFGSSLKETILSNLKEGFLESQAIQPLMKKLTGTIYEATKDQVLDDSEREAIKTLYDQISNVAGDFYTGLQEIGNDLSIDLGVGDTSSSSGGSQISEITGSTRDLFTDLLTPLANFPSLLNINERIYNQLVAMSQNGLAIAGAGGYDVSVRIENLNVESQSNSSQSIASASVSDIESAIATAIGDGKRGRGQ
ncbi:hypothetical protein [Orenia marismortui]|uniref:hypothetical protein n=1 Tax=Orenia marismortui TaxID=46469 RepID=UPI00035F708E|nr:hypothetical protein [Orenia marismortui]